MEYLCPHVDVLDNVLLKSGCSLMVELLVGEVEEGIKQSPYLPLTDYNDDDKNFISDDPLLDKNFDDSHSQKDDKVKSNDLTVDSEQESHSTLGGVQSDRKEPLFQLGILKYIFSIFKNTLTKDKWLQHPTEQYALVWCLRSLKVIGRNHEITF